MSTKRYYTLLIVAAAVIGGLAISASAHPGHSALRGNFTARAPVAIEIMHFKVAKGSNHKAGFVNNGFERKSSSLGEAAPAPGSLPAIVNEEMGKCLRGGDCTCTSSNHAVTHCYLNSGDCYNHEGLLCIW